MRPESAPGLTIRDAVPEDLQALVALSRKTFVDKFGHLYDPEDLASFLEDSHSEAVLKDFPVNIDFRTECRAIATGRNPKPQFTHVIEAGLC